MTKKKEKDLEAILEEHLTSGKFFVVGDIRTFYLDQGKGEVVLCVHGVPTSSFLYRKVLKALKKKGYRAICIDLPGLGLSDRPEEFDYTFSGFADFLTKAIRALDIKKFHLVVHDIGGPIGFAIAAKYPENILSLSVLNSWIDVVNYTKPLVMKPFEIPLLGEAELIAITPLTWPLVFNMIGVLNPDSVSTAEKIAYVSLLKREDGGKAFLKIMRSFQDTTEFRALCIKAVQNAPYPIQIIWGEKDPALDYARYAIEIKKVSGIDSVVRLPARHLLQEEVWEEISEEIDSIIKRTHLI